jgi:hypothetical protein
MAQWHRYSNDECALPVTSAVFVHVSRIIVVVVVANQSEASDSVMVALEARVETQLSKKGGRKLEIQTSSAEFKPLSELLLQFMNLTFQLLSELPSLYTLILLCSS